jgi:hypothetical protein
MQTDPNRAQGAGPGRPRARAPRALPALVALTLAGCGVEGDQTCFFSSGVLVWHLVYDLPGPLPDLHWPEYLPCAPGESCDESLGYGRCPSRGIARPGGMHW